MKNEEKIQEKFKRINPYLNEQSRRLWCANEALSIGWGGIKAVSIATGVARNTIVSGIKEIKGKKEVSNNIRRKGGGRKKTTDKDETLKKDLESLLEPYTRGDPETPLKWTCKSTRNLSEELRKKNHNASHNLVSRLLKDMGYSLQSNKKTLEGASNPDRNKQFHYINNKTKEFQRKNEPVISVDTKKKENIGNFKNNGREYYKKGKAPEVNSHDFPDKNKGKVAPYGIYDVSKNDGYVNVGISNDTAEFAVNSIRNWWYKMGKAAYSDAKKLYITADCGGSNGYRIRLWKVELQKFADELEIELHVSHFPPGTSKWNKIEHRMFSFITKNWRGKPLIERATVVNLIGNTTTREGLKIKAMLDENIYEKGIKISDKELSIVNIYKYKFHGEWNYKISPLK